MRTAIVIHALFLFAAGAVTPALGQMCDTRCDVGEVWSEKERTCVPEDPKTS